MCFANKWPESKVFVISSNFCAGYSSYKNFFNYEIWECLLSSVFFFNEKKNWLNSFSRYPLFLPTLHVRHHILLLNKWYCPHSSNVQMLWSRSMGINECSNSSLKSIMNVECLLKFYYRTQILDKVYLADSLFQMQKLFVWK